MKTSTARAFARAGLLGNPSDGYHGKTISISIRNFWADASVSQADQYAFESIGKRSVNFGSLPQLLKSLPESPSKDGISLLQSTVAQFAEYANKNGLRNIEPCRIQFQSNIPRQVGLAGSSAIVIATLRAACQWYGLTIDSAVMATLALDAERTLGIEGGLQDRVIQCYEGTVYMDFGREAMRNVNGIQIGKYEPLEIDAVLGAGSVHGFYVAFDTSLSESTTVPHNKLRQQFNSGNVQVIEALNQIAQLAEDGKRAIADGNIQRLSQLMDRNFDLRHSMCELNPGHVRMIETARASGVSAKFCGSGGAIIGVYPDQHTFRQLCQAMNRIGCEVIQPIINSAD